MELSTGEKLGIMKSEYRISVDDNLRKDVGEMCNLSQGIREKAKDDEKNNVIMNMHKEGYISEQIAKIVEKMLKM